MEYRRHDKRIYVLLAGMLFLIAFAFGIAPPRDFPMRSIITVEEGDGLAGVAQKLENDNAIRSALWFKAISVFLRAEFSLKAGQYYFEKPESAIIVAWRIFHGDYRIESLKITIPEGFTAEKISVLFDERFPFFDNALFKRLAPEGFLFPDTYFVPVTATASSTIKLLRDNFVRKIFDVMPEVEESGRTLEEIITMASLIEGEANTQEDRVMVSDVLWKRLRIGMPLQVDVERTTYEFRGLPPKPINNPGLLSIEAALNPTTTPYLYYLTGNDGKMHYARTFDEHQTNIQKYLR